MVKVYIIDPVAKTVEESEGEGFEDWNRMVGCQIGTIAYVHKDGHCVWLDDEAIYNQNPLRFTMIEELQQALPGKMVFMGPEDEEGETMDAQRKPKVTFGEVLVFNGKPPVWVSDDENGPHKTHPITY